MTQTWLFVASVALYSVPPLLCALTRTTFTFVLLYAHLAAMYVIAGLLGASWTFTVLGVEVLAGQVAYGGLVLTAVVTLVLGRDAQVLRNVLVATTVVAVVFTLTVRLALAALGTPGTQSLLAVRSAPFAPTLRGDVAGPLLFVVEVLLLLAVLEGAKRRLGPQAMMPVYLLGFVGVLVLDGVLFPVLALSSVPDLGAAVTAGVLAKLVLAAAYAVPLLAFVLLNRRAVDRFTGTPVPLKDLLSLSTDPVLTELRDSSRREGEVRATVSALLGASTSTVLLVTDPQLRVTGANHGTALLLGTERERLVGTGVDAFLDVDPTRWAREADGQHRPVPYRRPDGSTGTLSLSLSELSTDGVQLGYLACGEDVTERERAARTTLEALHAEQQAVARLLEADRVKDELVSTVSHELRTPLTTMRGWIELLDAGDLGRLEPEQRSALEKVARNNERLQHLVEDLLHVARGDEERLRLDPVDLADLVGTATADLARMASTRDLRVGTDLPEGPVEVAADALALERLLLNLVGNAMKFTPAGGSITVAVRRRDALAELVVTDTGSGIADDDLPHVFERFWRAPDARERQVPGSGLGLDVARRIAVAHGGGIDLSSRLGEGTTVVVTLPLLRA